MDAVNGRRNSLLMLHSHKMIDVKPAHKLKKEINDLQSEFCFTLESYAGQSYPIAIDQAISTAQYYVLFLTIGLLKYDYQILKSSIYSIHKKTQDNPHKLAVVLHELPMSKVRDEGSLILLRDALENAIDTSLPEFRKDKNNEQYEWQKIAKQVCKNLRSGPRVTISPPPGK